MSWSDQAGPGTSLDLNRRYMTNPTDRTRRVKTGAVLAVEDHL